MLLLVRLFLIFEHCVCSMLLLPMPHIVYTGMDFGSRPLSVVHGLSGPKLTIYTFIYRVVRDMANKL
jgi:hypothetical protein